MAKDETLETLLDVLLVWIFFRPSVDFVAHHTAHAEQGRYIVESLGRLNIWAVGGEGSSFVG